MDRAIFSINSGRSGSRYLSRLLGSANNVAAFHEADPDMAGRYVKWFPSAELTPKQMLLAAPVYAQKLRKIVAIRRAMKGQPAGQIYAETNFQFILSFYDVAMRFFPSVDVVLMRRYLPKVLKSWMDLGWFKADHRHTPYWCGEPGNPGAAVKALASRDQLEPIDWCIWYLIDVEGRAQRFKQQYPAARVVEVRLEELNDLERVKAMFAQLEIEPGQETEDVVGKAVWARTHEKVKTGIDLPLEYCRERIEQYVERCRSAGIAVPDLPHMAEI